MQARLRKEAAQRAQEAAEEGVVYMGGRKTTRHATMERVSDEAPQPAPEAEDSTIENDTFDDDQKRAMADYIELSLQLQYNNRGRT